MLLWQSWQVAAGRIKYSRIALEFHRKLLPGTTKRDFIWPSRRRASTLDFWEPVRPKPLRPMSLKCGTTWRPEAFPVDRPADFRFGVRRCRCTSAGFPGSERWSRRSWSSARSEIWGWGSKPWLDGLWRRPCSGHPEKIGIDWLASSQSKQPFCTRFYNFVLL